MANPAYASTPPPFDPPDCVCPVFDLLGTSARSRLVKLHKDGRQTWSASLDGPMQDSGLVLKREGYAYLSPWGCGVAIYAHYQGVT